MIPDSDSDPDPAGFVSDLQDGQKIFFANYFSVPGGACLLLVGLVCPSTGYIVVRLVCPEYLVVRLVCPEYLVISWSIIGTWKGWPVRVP
jgi:hypothetical protein